jgi:serine O-acetyltransferase
VSAPRRITWRETRARLREDLRRLQEVLGERPPFIRFHPSYMCVFLHRVSHYFFSRGNRFIARFFWHLNFVMTGADISEPMDLGPGLVILNPAGTSVMGNAGKNLTLMPCSGLGGEVGRREDHGAGAGLPVVGDDVLLEPHSGVLGPVRVGSRVRLGGNLGLTKDVDDDSIVEGPQPRFLKRRDIDEAGH